MEINEQTVQIIFNGLIVLFASVTTLFVIFQHNLEKTKIRLDAFPKRSEVLNAIQDCISSIAGSAEVDIRTLGLLIKNTQNASFLFNKKDHISEYIESLYKKGLELHFKQKRLRQIDYNKLRIKEEERIQLIDEIYDISMWFLSQNDIAKEKFKKYLQIVK
jgi:hypothetical protein